MSHDKTTDRLSFVAKLASTLAANLLASQMLLANPINQLQANAQGPDGVISSLNYGTSLNGKLNFNLNQSFSFDLPEGTVDMKWTRRFSSKKMTTLVAHSSNASNPVTLKLFVSNNGQQISGYIKSQTYNYIVSPAPDGLPYTQVISQSLAADDEAKTNAIPEHDVIPIGRSEIDAPQAAFNAPQTDPFEAYSTPTKNARTAANTSTRTPPPPWQKTINSFNPFPTGTAPAKLLPQYPTINKMMSTGASEAMFKAALASPEIVDVDILVMYDKEQPVNLVKTRLAEQLQTAREALTNAKIKVNLRVVGLEPYDYGSLYKKYRAWHLWPLYNALEAFDEDEKQKFDEEMANGGKEYYQKAMTQYELNSLWREALTRDHFHQYGLEDPFGWSPQDMEILKKATMKYDDLPQYMRHFPYGTMGWDLRDARHNTEYLEPEFLRVKALREKTGADIVLLIGGKGDYSMGGYTIAAPTTHAKRNEQLIMMPVDAITVSSGKESTLIHEIGHIFGLMHDYHSRTPGFDGRGAYVYGYTLAAQPYNLQKRNDTGGHFIDLMSSRQHNGEDGRPLYNVISNPDVLWRNEYPTGSRTGENPSDGARAMNEFRFIVSNAMPKKVAQELSIDIDPAYVIDDIKKRATFTYTHGFCSYTQEDYQWINYPLATALSRAEVYSGIDRLNALITTCTNQMKTSRQILRAQMDKEPNQRKKMDMEKDIESNVNDSKYAMITMNRAINELKNLLL